MDKGFCLIVAYATKLISFAFQFKIMLEQFEKSLIPWMGKTIKMIDYIIENVFEENQIDLSKIQFVLLKIIQDNEGVQQNQIATFLNRNKSSLTRMITALEKKGFLTRINSKIDKRAKSLQLTIEGNKTVEKAIPILLNAIEALEKGLTKEEIESTIDVLKKIQTNIAGSELGICLNNKQ